MNRSSFVPVEGELAQPGITPLSGIPFGREWTFRGAVGARPRKSGVAKLITSCIDITAPHRACGWKPLLEPSDAVSPAAKPSPGIARRIALRRPAVRPARQPSRGALAACWTFGAVAIIGWLVAAHTPTPFGASVQSAGSGIFAAWRAATSSIAELTENTPVHVATAPAAAVTQTPPATTAHAQQPGQAVRPAAEPQALAAAPRQASPRQEESAHPAIPSYARRTTAATPPVAVPAAPAASRPQQRAAAPVAGNASDDPSALIALANTLRARQPASVAPTRPLAGIDWTARLSHSRLTDTPDAFAQ
ncbi:hypothetical protein [Burkholderia guangdongensis]|uniref:hypothetical protein n=1 Tax=Burkholderia guangdongensis TaxID=1792500 RepID=UPI0015CC9A44|nr:hypothetical protein [Burkholderia guangdongensis]